jgi:hypothetical protein
MATRREFLKQTSAIGLAAAACRPIARAAQTGAPTPASNTLGIVQTVLGPLDASKLGFTLTHEHICRKRGRSFRRQSELGRQGGRQAQGGAGRGRRHHRRCYAV